MANVWALVLAAGASSRFGGIKALAPWQGGTLLLTALTTAQTVCGKNVMIVTGAHHNALLPHLSTCHHVYNSDWAAGMGSSITCGINGILQQDPAANIILILPVDQPFVTAAHLQALIDQADALHGVAFTTDGTITGPPAAIHHELFNLVQQLPPDGGLKQIAACLPSASVFHNKALIDLDTPDQFSQHANQ